MKLLCFAHVAGVTGCRELVLGPPQPGTGEAMWTELTRRYPAIEPLRPQLRLARNGEFVPWEAALAETDELALIPPVSGG